MPKQTSAVTNDVAFGFLPTDKKGRIFSFWDLILVQVVIGLSAFGLLTGAYTGSMLGSSESLAAVLFGNAFPMFLIAPIILFFARYGIDTFIGFRSSLGYKGAQAFFFIFLALTLGYIAIALFMAGEALVEVAVWLGLPALFTSPGTGTPFFAIFLFALAFLVTVRGPAAIRKFNLFAVPAFIIFLVGLLGIIVFGQHIPALSSLLPAEPFETNSRSLAIALEINIGLGFSWLPYLGQYSRLAKKESSAFKAGFYSYGVIVALAAIVGALATLIAGSLAPASWMMAIAGTYGGLIGLLLLTVANLGAAIFLMYSQAVSFKTLFPKRTWLFSMGTTIPAVLLLLSATFYNAFGSFIAVVSFIMASLGGIIIADYFFVKKQKISLRHLYDTQGAYTYWKGINPSALVAIGVSILVYWGLYNPLTFNSSNLFLYMSAGIPTYFAALISYYVSAKYIFKYEVDQAGSRIVQESKEPAAALISKGEI
ncbi:cytosine permease [Planococcus sp. CPCC 101016]|uniref:purine-cytosine permease family protein n=1 Tax=Planococcus sp. CPCC 101016 TaxID=2599617 RepID=UPI0016482A28|nr:cytosine permease [Planococcus sp. CPCC 101016]